MIKKIEKGTDVDADDIFLAVCEDEYCFFVLAKDEMDAFVRAMKLEKVLRQKGYIWNYHRD